MVDVAVEMDGPGAHWLPEGLRRLTGGGSGPTLVALALALVSLPLTTLAIVGSPQPNTLDGSTAFDAGLGAVIVGALVGGSVGGRVRHRREMTGALLALVLGWAAAIVAFPVIPTILGQSFQLGQFCLDSCSPLIDTTGGSVLGLVYRMAEQYGISLVVGTAFGGIVAIPALLVAFFLGRRGSLSRRRVAAVIAAGAFGIMSMFSVQAMPGPFAILFAGVVLWAMILPRPAASEPAASAAALP